MKNNLIVLRICNGLIAFILFSIISIPGWSQTANEPVITLKGKLIAEDTKKPVSFAHIYVANTNIGTISNAEGAFILKVPESSVSNPIKISSMGFKTLTYNLNDLRYKENLITMIPEIINLQEVIVRADDPISLIRAALKNIPDNYGQTPYLCTAFYRESIMQNKQYVGIAEAVLNIYKSRYSSMLETDRIKVFKGIKSQDVKRMDTLIFKLQGGHYTALLLDIAKNPESFMQEDFFKSYDYKPVSIMNVEDHDNYLIEFEQKKDIQEPFYNGRLYLDVNSLAIKKVEFSLSPDGLKYADQFLVKKKPANTKVETVSGYYMADYHEVNGRWTLNHVHYEVKFKVDKKRQLFNKIYTSTVDLVITDKDTVNIAKFKLSESLKPTQVFVDHVNDYYDEGFWGSFNIIKPEEPIEEAVERISKRMKRYQEAK
jgi:hypothetical protein